MVNNPTNSFRCLIENASQRRARQAVLAARTKLVAPSAGNGRGTLIDKERTGSAAYCCKHSVSADVNRTRRTCEQLKGTRNLSGSTGRPLSAEITNSFTMMSCLRYSEERSFASSDPLALSDMYWLSLPITK